MSTPIKRNDGLSRVGLICSAMLCMWAGATGCSLTGPISVRGDRFNYNQAGAQSTREQLLLNIVRLRYRESIYLLEVGSMISSHNLVANASFSGWWNNLNELENPALMAFFGNDKHPTQQNTLGAGLSYTDSPTITYTPVQGEKFADRMMTAIPQTTIFQLCDSGWGIDQLLECCVQRINGIPNVSIGAIRDSVRTPDPRFGRVATLLRELQDADSLVFVVETPSGGEKGVYLEAAPELRGMEEERRELRDLLGYPEIVSKLKLVAAPFKRGPDELALQTRSLLGVMCALSRGVAVPEEHVKCGWAKDLPAQCEADDSGLRWLQVCCSALPPVKAFVQVCYKEHWFFIDEWDSSSKETFALLNYLFSLQQSGQGQELPVVTVPAK